MSTNSTLNDYCMYFVHKLLHNIRANSLFLQKIDSPEMFWVKIDILFYYEAFSLDKITEL